MNELYLSREQIEILFKLEYLKTLNDIDKTPAIPENHVKKDLKKSWLYEWGESLCKGFPYFLQDYNAILNLEEDKDSMLDEVKRNRLSQSELQPVVLESMIFEPYFPLNVEDKEGGYVIKNDYSMLKYSEENDRTEKGYKYLNECIAKERFGDDYLLKFKRCYNDCVRKCQEYGLPSRPYFLHLIYSMIPMGFTIKNNKQMAVELIGSEFIGLDEACFSEILLSYFGSGVVSANSSGISRGAKGSLGKGDSSDYVHKLTETFLSFILDSLE